jgi:hypothetical protein
MRAAAPFNDEVVRQIADNGLVLNDPNCDQAVHADGLCDRHYT